MRKSNIYRYFAFGYNYYILKKDGVSGLPVADGIKQIEDFLSYLDELDLQVTKGVAANLTSLLQELKEPTQTHVLKEHASRITEILGKLDPTLDSELTLRHAYILTPKRYAVEKLLDSPSELLSKQTLLSLSPTAFRDYRAACRLIALSQPTAAAFHLMRALEQQVKVLYFAFKKTKRLDKPMWGPMTTQLRTKRQPKPTPKLLDHLDSMRVHFRNPTQHPEAFYTLDEAQDLLNQTMAALGMIASELPDAPVKAPKP